MRVCGPGCPACCRAQARGSCPRSPQQPRWRCAARRGAAAAPLQLPLLSHRVSPRHARPRDRGRTAPTLTLAQPTGPPHLVPQVGGHAHEEAPDQAGHDHVRHLHIALLLAIVVPPAGPAPRALSAQAPQALGTRAAPTAPTKDHQKPDLDAGARRSARTQPTPSPHTQCSSATCKCKTVQPSLSGMPLERAHKRTASERSPPSRAVPHA